MSQIDPEPSKTGNVVIDTLDAVIDDAGELIGGRGQKIAGGAAVGAIAAVVLPFSLVTGALIGAGYAAWRQAKR